MKSRLSMRVPHVKRLGPGQQVIDGFVSTLIARPVKRRLPLVIHTVHIKPLRLQERQRVGPIGLGSNVYGRKACSIPNIELSSILVNQFEHPSISLKACKVNSKEAGLTLRRLIDPILDV